MNQSTSANQPGNLDKIHAFFSRFIVVDDASWDIFKTRIKFIHFDKGEVIYHPGQLCTTIGFICDGIVRSYILKPDGKDFTWFFHYYKKDADAKQFMLVDYPSFMSNKPSIYGFQTLTPCSIAIVTHKVVDDFIKTIPSFHYTERKLIISAYYQSNQRLLSLLATTSEDRLRKFEQEHAPLFDKIPHYHIASYLGISPQRLSQLRNK